MTNNFIAMKDYEIYIINQYIIYSFIMYNKILGFRNSDQICKRFYV